MAGVLPGNAPLLVLHFWLTVDKVAMDGAEVLSLCIETYPIDCIGFSLAVSTDSDNAAAAVYAMAFAWADSFKLTWSRRRFVQRLLRTRLERTRHQIPWSLPSCPCRPCFRRLPLQTLQTGGVLKCPEPFGLISELLAPRLMVSPNIHQLS